VEDKELVLAVVKALVRAATVAALVVVPPMLWPPTKTRSDVKLFDTESIRLQPETKRLKASPP
jgi:hypothetical protein